MEGNGAAKTLRRELEGWREIIIRIQAILNWEKQYYAGVIFGVVNVILLIIHAVDFSMLTWLSIFGIFFVLADFLIPHVSQWAFGIDNWTGEDEKKYEQAILSICNCFSCIPKTKDYILDLKKTQPKGFFIKTVGFLLVTAWIGTWINAFIYALIINFVLLYPGLKKEKKFQEIKGTLFGAIGVKSSCLKKD